VKIIERSDAKTLRLSEEVGLKPESGN